MSAPETVEPSTAPQSRLNLRLARNEAAVVGDPNGGAARAVYVRPDNVMVYAMESELPPDVKVIFHWRFDARPTEVTMGKKKSSGGKSGGKKPGAVAGSAAAKKGSSKGGKASPKK